MSLIEFAKKELADAGYFTDQDFYGGMTGKAVLELIECFANQGHSGMSAGITLAIFNQLANYKPINPIEDKIEDWSDSVGDGTILQHKKLSSLFKTSGDRAYYLDAIAFQGPEEFDSFVGSIGKVQSRQYVKTWPFTPKTFKIKLDKEAYVGQEYDPEFASVVETGPGPMLYTLSDKTQLVDVFFYYDEYTKQI